MKAQKILTALLIFSFSVVFSEASWSQSNHYKRGSGRGGSNKGPSVRFGGDFGRGHVSGYRGSYRSRPSFGFFLGSPYYDYGYPYFGTPYYSPPRVITIPSPPPVYIQQPPPVVQQYPSGYWYYCSNPEGYYPYIKECANGWQQVEPTPPPQ